MIMRGNETHTILIVEDNDAERDALARVLRLERYTVVSTRHPAEALTHASSAVDLVISDLCMGTQSGLDLLQIWRQQQPYTPFILLTGYGTVDQAVTAMKLGALDFLTKPIDPVKLISLLERTLGGSRAELPGREVLRRINDKRHGQPIIGSAPALVETCAQALRAAPVNSTVLVLGESGTGKELIAEALHYHSARSQGPFVVVNMAAIPEALVESELFGHVKGAFTTAIQDRVGRFESANGGTLFIDEVGDFPQPVQAKLLRVLETRRLTPVGGNREIPVDVRIVAATSRPLTKYMEAGQFREDLYFRLNVIGLQLPPLRDRRSDIPLLAEHFLAQFSRFGGLRPLRINQQLMERLMNHEWPGNVRHLRNCLERMSVLAHSDVLTPEDLPPDLRDATGEADGATRMESLKKSAMLDAIRQFGGNRTRAAEFLGISVRTLQRRLREWGEPV